MGEGLLGMEWRVECSIGFDDVFNTIDSHLGAASAGPSVADASGAQPRPAPRWAEPGRVVQVAIVDAQQRRDTSGTRFGAFTVRALVISTTAANGGATVTIIWQLGMRTRSAAVYCDSVVA